MQSSIAAIRSLHEQSAAAADANHTLVLTALTFAEKLDRDDWHALAVRNILRVLAERMDDAGPQNRMDEALGAARATA